MVLTSHPFLVPRLRIIPMCACIGMSRDDFTFTLRFPSEYNDSTVTSNTQRSPYPKTLPLRQYNHLPAPSSYCLNLYYSFIQTHIHKIHCLADGITITKILVKSGKYFRTASHSNLSLHAYCDVSG